MLFIDQLNDENYSNQTLVTDDIFIKIQKKRLAFFFTNLLNLCTSRFCSIQEKDKKIRCTEKVQK